MLSKSDHNLCLKRYKLYCYTDTLHTCCITPQMWMGTTTHPSTLTPTLTACTSVWQVSACYHPPWEERFWPPPQTAPSTAAISLEWRRSWRSPGLPRSSVTVVFGCCGHSTEGGRGGERGEEGREGEKGEEGRERRGEIEEGREKRRR